MTKTAALYRNQLPQTRNTLLVCDGGMETTMIYHEGIELPAFASFTLLQSDKGIATLKSYYARYAAIARQQKTGLIIEAATWRANTDWGKHLGLNQNELDNINRQSIQLLADLRSQWSAEIDPIVIGGVIGPRGDGYIAEKRMTASEAADYHSAQMRIFAASEADLVTAYTLNYVEEAIGITLSAKVHQMPIAISFTLETDGRLPSGQELREAIMAVDEATDHYPAYYQINCAHPSHFEHIFARGGVWLDRIRGLRANASRKSHAELDASTELDDGSPEELGQSYKLLNRQLRKLSLIGGCCGTDHRHIAAMCKAVMG
jgi:S-methylmethionine-dependent homocysteine/selenocysteine methylase